MLIYLQTCLKNSGVGWIYSRASVGRAKTACIEALSSREARTEARSAEFAMGSPRYEVPSPCEARD